MASKVHSPSHPHTHVHVFICISVVFQGLLEGLFFVLFFWKIIVWSVSEDKAKSIYVIVKMFWGLENL